MVITFGAVVLLALAYVLAIGWERTKPKSRVQTEQPQCVSDHQSPPEVVQVGGRVHTASMERDLWQTESKHEEEALALG